MSEPEPHAGSTPARPRSSWLTPAGISALAGVAGVLVIVIGWFVTGELRNGGGSVPPGGGSSSPAAVPEDAGTRLFVYGTSMPGQAGYGVLDRFVEATRRDEVDGLLFDSGRGYPLAKFDAGGTIRGYLLELDEATADEALTAMTQYEGGMFHPVEVRTESGVTATAYEWIQDTEGFPRIDAWDSTLAEFGRETPVNALVLDDCFDLSATAGMGITVNCEAPHQFKVYHRDLFTDAAFPGLPALETTAYTECSKWFEVHYGSTFDPQSTQLYYPSEASWAEGDRVLICAAAP
jgi:gamma-glutamylcyclotransferase (GGCT)/AIG2-like uncharacterized protein YtfP